MPIGEPRKLEHKWRFKIEVDGFVSAKFTKCSALEAEVAKVEHWEGGSLIPIKEPGRVTVTDLTLDRGVGLDRDIYDWFKEVVNFAKMGGFVAQDVKRNLDIVQLNRDGSEARRWTLYNAWPQKFNGGEWDNTSDDAVIEQLVLAYDYFEEV